MTTCKAGKFVKLLVFHEFDNKQNTKKPLHVVKKAQRLPWLEMIQGPRLEDGYHMIVFFSIFSSNTSGHKSLIILMNFVQVCNLPGVPALIYSFQVAGK